MGDNIKNAINYYYGLNITNIKQYNDCYYFVVENNNYILKEIKNEIYLDEKYKFSYEVKKYININEIIISKFKQPYISINNKKYVLEKIKVINRKIEFNDIINPLIINTVNSKLIKNNWRLMWTNKIDYIETQISENSKKYLLINDSINYYIGLSENAIQLLDDIKTNLYISHIRIKKDYTLVDFYDPLNIIIDTRVRDVAEYFKDCFFKNEDIEKDIDEYIYNSNLNVNEKILFLARMMFPTYYFDQYEKVVNNEENSIENIISKVDEYEDLISKIYLKLNLNIEIEWLIKT